MLLQLVRRGLISAPDLLTNSSCATWACHETTYEIVGEISNLIRKLYLLCRILQVSMVD